MLTVELTVTPGRASGDTLLDIRGAVRNHGSSTVDTQVWKSTLLVDGIPCERWSWVIANGIRDEREFALPPGEQVEFRRVLLAGAVLPEPGRHELVLVVRNIPSPKVIVARVE